MADPLANLDLPEKALIDIAVNLREMRETCGWSPEELAQMADVPVDLIRAYEADPARISHATVSQVTRAMMAHDEANRAAGRPPDPRRPPVLAQMETQMLEMEAALHIDQRRFRKAQAALDSALALKPLPARKGRLLLSHAVVLAELRRERRALEDLEEAERCLDRARSPLLWLRMRLQQMECLCRLGRHEDAARRRGEVEELMAQVGRDLERLQLLSSRSSPIRRTHGWSVTSGCSTARRCVSASATTGGPSASRRARRSSPISRGRAPRHRGATAASDAARVLARRPAWRRGGD